jgi:serine/threonine protein kinase
VLRRRWCKDPQRVELFDREGRVGQSLVHTNIVRTLMVGSEAATGQYYLVMDFVEGGNLRDFLAIRKKLAPVEALRLLEDTAQGLAYAHSRGVTHRDIKLTNILIASEGRALLVDFGLAQIYAGQEDVKVERTIDYAALEKATGTRPGDVRSDIFFLGCILYEMLTGRPPLITSRDRTARAQIQRFDNIPPVLPNEVEGPPSVIHLVETMMAFRPQQRYQTVAQVLEAIRSVRRDLEGKPPDPDTPTTKSVFVAESDQRLQDALRDKLKSLGYRVFLAADPARAVDRYRHQPFDALVLDAGTTGEDGLNVFERIMAEADRRRLECAGILILGRDQADWVHRIPPRPSVAVMVRPVTLKQLHHKLQDLVPLPSQKAKSSKQ